jgi:hypothetical protein
VASIVHVGRRSAQAAGEQRSSSRRGGRLKRFSSDEATAEREESESERGVDCTARGWLQQSEKAVRVRGTSSNPLEAAPRRAAHPVHSCFLGLSVSDSGAHSPPPTLVIQSPPSVATDASA